MAAALECWSGRPSTDEDMVEQVLMKTGHRSEAFSPSTSSAPPATASSASPTSTSDTSPPLKKWHRLGRNFSGAIAALRSSLNLLDSSSQPRGESKLSWGGVVRSLTQLFPSSQLPEKLVADIRRHFDALPSSYSQARFDMKDILLHIRLVDQAVADDLPAFQIQQIHDEISEGSVFKLTFACNSSLSWPTISSTIDGSVLCRKKIQIFEKKGLILGVFTVVIHPGGEKQFKSRIDTALRSAAKKQRIPTVKLHRRWLDLLLSAEQRATLVNVKLKWVKDRTLDSVVVRERHLRQVHRLVELISSDPRGGIPADELPRRPLQLGLLYLMPSDFLLRFPALFRRSSASSSGWPTPSFHLTDDAFQLRELELSVLRANEPDLVDRLRRLLMLTADCSLPLHTVDQLRWDMGLPENYHKTIIQRYPHFFSLAQPDGDERVWLKLSSRDPLLAVSELQKSSGAGGSDSDSLAFPVSFTRGFALKRKCMMWLQEWQTLPYTSPYEDPSGLDRRTDVSEKRIVGVFHELLHLSIGKKTERSNFSNLRKPLRLPQKFTTVFERHPGIFYLSQKLGVQTVVLREAYSGGRELVSKHPLVSIRERYASMMKVRRSDIFPGHCISEESDVVSSEDC